MASGMLSRRIRVFGALDSFRRELERPCHEQRDRKSDHDHKHEQTNYPIRDVEDRKDLRDSLRKRPACHDVSDGDLVYIAPLQLAEEYLRIHRPSLLVLIFWRE